MDYTYKNSGVDINLANATVKDIKKILKNNIDGDFACLIEHPFLENFYLCATTDGIGSKILPLLAKEDYATIANDLIAMNLNDLACVGAFPVLFLDYIAINNFDADICTEIVEELQKQLQIFHCPLVGGEIAELKSIIKEKTLDISGFAVGLVEKKSCLGKHNVKDGDILVGLESSGVHANGFSLVNNLAQNGLIDIKNATNPTRIYVKEVLELNKKGLIKAAANITGGGLYDNIARIIPNGCKFSIDKTTLPKIEIFEEMKKFVAEEEMFRVFNMGCGMVLAAEAKNLDEIFEITKKYNPRKIGEINAW